ncbi:MAG: 4-hydroxy-tetrahydrodipicolinate reductase [Spirochaetia bacterium]|nr:4-hydroxy-tetrahydrodipicolinate reductase [Spirochaetia bacterium]
MIPFAMIGAAGRMGRSIIALSESENLRLTGAMEHTASVHINSDAGELAGLGKTGILLKSDPETVIDGSKVVIDFSNPETTVTVSEICREKGAGLVVGTTGFSDEQKEKILSIADKVPVLISPNMSQGVNVLFYLASAVSKMVGSVSDIEITEAHHRHKKDAPSGTALRIKDVILDSLKRSEEDVVYGRYGITGERDHNEIGVHAVRGGDTVGDHTVSFFMDGERIELTHRATSRNTFARGALRAAFFLADQPPGIYQMKDVLKLSS